MNATTCDILNALADCLPETGVRIETKGEDDRLWLPMPPGADYGLYIDTHASGAGLVVVVLGAVPMGKPWGAFPLDLTGLTLRLAEGEEGGAVQSIASQARRVILCRSRIVESVGFLLCRLRCEVEENGEWTYVCQMITHRLFFLPPLAFRRATWTYHSAPLASADTTRGVMTVFSGGLDYPQPDRAADRLTLVGCAALLFFAMLVAETMCGWSKFR